MTPEAFIAKWRVAQLKERSAALEHLWLLGEPTPTEADPTGDAYALSVARDLRDRAGVIGDDEVGGEFGG